MMARSRAQRAGLHLMLTAAGLGMRWHTYRLSSSSRRTEVLKWYVPASQFLQVAAPSNPLRDGPRNAQR